MSNPWRAHVRIVLTCAAAIPVDGKVRVVTKTSLFDKLRRVGGGNKATKVSAKEAAATDAVCIMMICASAVMLVQITTRIAPSHTVTAPNSPCTFAAGR